MYDSITLLSNDFTYLLILIITDYILIMNTGNTYVKNTMTVRGKK